MDTHLPAATLLHHIQDPLTMVRVNVRARCAAPSSTMLLRLDATRIEWLAGGCEQAGLLEHARLGRSWVEELRQAADKIDAQNALDEQVAS
jgi:xanthine/CO dehydrogenase XdhC/CoxF family maturation factor